MAKYRHEKLIPLNNERDLVDALNRRFKRVEEFAGDLTQDEADLLYAALVHTHVEADITDLDKYTQAEIDTAISDFFNGTIVEDMTVALAEAAGVVTMSLTGPGTSDLTMRFSTGPATLDCTPPATIALTVGTDASPQGNWIYIPISTKVLTKSTTGWPTTEHIKVGYFLVQSAAKLAADGGAYVHQIWNDHRKGGSGMGHMAHMAERMRQGGAQYFSGIDGAGTSDYLTVGAGTSDFKSTAGIVWQMHRHDFPAVDMSTGDLAHVVNWFGDAYHEVSDLFEITADSTGSAISNNRYFNLVFWGVANDTGTHEPIMVNLPSGSYVLQSAAEADSDGYDDFTIPREFALDSSTGFLICRVTIQMGATWTVVSTVDLRGTTPQSASGGGVGTTVTDFSDAQFSVFDDLDNTKTLNLQLSGVTTATTRTLTVPDASGTIMLVGDAPAAHTHVEADITDLQAYLLDITGESIHDLSDVGASAGIVGNVLTYQAGVWTDMTPAAAGLSTVGHTHLVVDITDFDPADYLPLTGGTLVGATTVDVDGSVPLTITTNTTPLSITSSVANTNWIQMNDVTGIGRVGWTGSGAFGLLAQTSGIHIDLVTTGLGEVRANGTEISVAGHTHVEADITDLDHYTTTDFGVDFAAKSTTDLSEGTNLYFTNARADARIALANIADLANVTDASSAAGWFLRTTAANTWVAQLGLVEADITDLGSYVEAGVAETITGGWDFTTAVTKFNTNFLVDAGISNADYLDLKWNKQYVRLILDADNDEAGSFFSIHQNGTADECFRVAPSSATNYLLGASYSSSAQDAQLWSNADTKLVLKDGSTGGNYIDFYTTTTRRAYIGTDATNYDLYLEALTSGSDIRLEVNSGAVYLNDGGASSGRVASIATLTTSATAPTSSAYPYGAIWGIYTA